MNNKLTLRMDESLIASAKDYAATHGSSVSQMVANYFAALAHMPPASLGNTSGPVTRHLTGLLKPPAGQSPVTRDDYYTYLERRHLGGFEEKSL